MLDISHVVFSEWPAGARAYVYLGRSFLACWQTWPGGQRERPPVQSARMSIYISALTPGAIDLKFCM